jgi:hypothetical protein
VRHLNGGVATWEWDDGGFTGRYLESEYATPASGLKNIVTVLFPHDPDHAKATMSRLSISGFTGATIDHGSGTVDTALESSAAASLAHDGDTFTGKALLCRKASGANVFYFVRNGTSFSTTNGPANGFSSLVPVSITMRGTVGRIVSPGTRVRFTYPRITGVRINGSLAPNVGADPDWVEVDVPSGTHTVELVTN